MKALGSLKQVIVYIFYHEPTQTTRTRERGSDKSVISRHLKKLFAEEELDEKATVAKIATVQIEGGREVSRTPDFFSSFVLVSEVLGGFFVPRQGFVCKQNQL